jgi:hypothetical protein
MYVAFTLDPARHAYLQDHRLDGKPVFPFAMAMELVSEAAQQRWPSLQVTSVQRLQVLRGIIVDGNPKALTVVVRGASEPCSSGAGCAASVEIVEASDPARPYYRAVVELSEQLPAPPPYRHPGAGRLVPFALTAEQAYEQWLFHGPRFRGITEIAGISNELLVATCRPSSPKELLAGETAGEWLIDPVIFDSALQMIILWTRSRRDATPLPSEFRRYLRFGSLSQSPVRCYLRIADQPESPIVSGDVAFLGPNDALLGLLEEMKCPSSKALNRLGKR